MELSKRNKLLKDNNDKINIVKIVNGQIISGNFDKSTFKTSKGLVHTICNDYGYDKAANFINDLQKISSYILLIDGFSVGISDVIADSKTIGNIKEVIDKKKDED